MLVYQVILEDNALKHRLEYGEHHWRNISYRSFPLFVTVQFSVASSVPRKMFAVVQSDMHSPGWEMKSRGS